MTAKNKVAFDLVAAVSTIVVLAGILVACGKLIARQDANTADIQDVKVKLEINSRDHESIKTSLAEVNAKLNMLVEFKGPAAGPDLAKRASIGNRGNE